MVNRLKGLIGLCECKGCKNRHVFELEAKCETLKGKKKKHKNENMQRACSRITEKCENNKCDAGGGRR